MLALLLALTAIIAEQIDRAPRISDSGAGTLFGRMGAEFHREVTAMEPWIEKYGAVAIFGAIALEGVGIPAPGLTLLIAGTLAAPAGKGAALWVLLCVSFLAAAGGNTLGYLLGRYGGRNLIQRFPSLECRVKSFEKSFDRHGGWLILVARFIDGPKQLNGIASGTLGMSWQRFEFFNVLGAALWVCFFVLGTYYVNEHLSAVLVLLRNMNPWIALPVALAVTFSLWFAFVHRNGRGRPG